MKGSREHKQYVARNRKMLKAYHWDDLMIFKFERCKKWFKRRKRITDEEME